MLVFQTICGILFCCVFVVAIVRAVLDCRESILRQKDYAKRAKQQSNELFQRMAQQAHEDGVRANLDAVNQAQQQALYDNWVAHQMSTPVDYGGWQPPTPPMDM